LRGVCGALSGVSVFVARSSGTPGLGYGPPNGGRGAYGSQSRAARRQGAKTWAMLGPPTGAGGGGGGSWVVWVRGSEASACGLTTWWSFILSSPRWYGHCGRTCCGRGDPESLEGPRCVMAGLLGGFRVSRSILSPRQRGKTRLAPGGAQRIQTAWPGVGLALGGFSRAWERSPCPALLLWRLYPTLFLGGPVVVHPCSSGGGRPRRRVRAPLVPPESGCGWGSVSVGGWFWGLVLVGRTWSSVGSRSSVRPSCSGAIIASDSRASGRRVAPSQAGPGASWWGGHRRGGGRWAAWRLLLSPGGARVNRAAGIVAPLQRSRRGGAVPGAPSRPRPVEFPDTDWIRK